jgi:hypothetical protein
VYCIVLYCIHKAAYNNQEPGSSVSIVSDYGLAFKGRYPVIIKMLTDNKITEQVNSFSYLGNLIYYENEMDTDNKLNNCSELSSGLYCRVK